MLYKTCVLPAFAAVVYAAFVIATPQLTTAIPLGAVDDSDSVRNSSKDQTLTGAIVGTGADGTTYVVSIEPTGGVGLTATGTIVENASGATLFASISVSGGVGLVESIGCGFSGNSAQCTEVDILIDATETSTQTVTTSGIPNSVAVVISTSSANSGSSASGVASTSASTQTSASRRVSSISAFASTLSLILATIVMT